MKNIIIFFAFITMLSFSKITLSQDCAVLDSSISESYSGKCKKGFAHGEGVAEGINKYEGNFKKGMKHKEGKYTWKDGGVYKGEFYEDKMHGEGKYIDSDTVITIGYWKNDKYVGATIDDFNGYKILSKTNVPGKPAFRKMGEGNEIIIFIDDIHDDVRNLIFLNYTSGQTENESNRKIRMINISFPFSAILKYRVPNTSNTFIMDVEMSFMISEPGIWNMTISHN